jgi:hypothetical protein
MSASDDTRKQPPAEAATPQSGNEDGGRKEPGAPGAPSGPVDGSATRPRAAAPSQGATPATGRANDDEDDDEWRHEPIAPVDERNPLRSLGRAIADVALDGSEPAPKPRDR